MAARRDPWSIHARAATTPIRPARYAHRRRRGRLKPSGRLLAAWAACTNEVIDASGSSSRPARMSAVSTQSGCVRTCRSPKAARRAREQLGHHRTHRLRGVGGYQRHSRGCPAEERGNTGRGAGGPGEVFGLGQQQSVHAQCLQIGLRTVARNISHTQSLQKRDRSPWLAARHRSGFGCKGVAGHSRCSGACRSPRSVPGASPSPGPRYSAPPTDRAK